jgi:hypothetical protein
MFWGGGLFGDKRLDHRLAQTFDAMAGRPSGTLPRKLVKRAPLVGGYRMLNNPKVTHTAILQAHRASCLRRLAGHTGKVLLLHDTTVLDYSGLDVEGLGQVGDGNGKGLYAHHSLAVVPATRQVVGLMNQILHRRADVPRGETKRQRQQRADRESRLWKQAVEGLPPMPAGVQVTDVSDRGSDITEYIAAEVALGRRFILRSRHNRTLADDPAVEQVEKLHDRLRALPVMETFRVRVPADKGGWREATMGLAWQPVEFKPPRQPRGEHGSEPIAGWGVIACEADPPPGAEPLEWMLLTNRPITTAGQAREAVEDYACRWMVEDYHKAMKTGCGVEELQMTTMHGLSNAVALLSVLAVHVLRLRCNARDETIRQQPARLHEEELKVQLAARDSRHPDWRAMTVWEFYIAVARMGGYVLNPRKRPPGWIVLWRGYTRLQDMCEGARLMEERCVQT